MIHMVVVRYDIHSNCSSRISNCGLVDLPVHDFGWDNL